VMCLRCRSPLELVVAIDERGVPSGEPGHDTVYDWTRVMSCPSCGYGDLRQFSHDCWPWEDEIDMEWSTQLQPEALALIRKGLAACPDPTVPTCQCLAHVRLRDTENHPKNLRIYPRREGDRPDGHVALRDDGAPEFIPSSRAESTRPDTTG
jgi:hypothetical protein